MSYKLSSYMEGIISDALKAGVDVDPDEIKQKWDDIDSKGSATPVLDKAQVLNDDGIQKAKDSIDKTVGALNKQKLSTKSIIARAKKSVLQFPIYCTSSLRTNEAHIISKLFERVYASLVQTVISQNQILDISEVNDLLFLKKYHTNLRECADLFVNEFYNTAGY